jgi:hypothetical protein
MRRLLLWAVPIGSEKNLSVSEYEDFSHRIPRRIVVIADTGSSAELLLFSADDSIGPGSLFRYHGGTWMVVSGRRDSGVLVAEPVEN